MASRGERGQGKHSAAGRAYGEAPAASGSQYEEVDANEGGKQNRSAMTDAIERGGLIGWASYLTFSWAGPFLKLGSTVTLKVDDLDGIYKGHKRCVLGLDCRTSSIAFACHLERPQRRGDDFRRSLPLSADGLDCCAKLPSSHTSPPQRTTCIFFEHQVLLVTKQRTQSNARYCCLCL